MTKRKPIEINMEKIESVPAIQTLNRLMDSMSVDEKRQFLRDLSDLLWDAGLDTISAGIQLALAVVDNGYQCNNSPLTIPEGISFHELVGYFNQLYHNLPRKNSPY